MFKKFFKVGLLKKSCKLNVDKKIPVKKWALGDDEETLMWSSVKNMQLEQVNHQNNTGN